MRRIDRELTEPQELDAVIRGAPYCTMAFCDQDAPYQAPMSFGYDGEHIYLHCAREGHKLDLLRRNPKVHLCFVSQCESRLGSPACTSSTRYTSVLMSGTARLTDDEAEKVYALDAIMAQHGATGPQAYDERLLGRTLVIVIEIVSVTGKRHL